MQYVHQPINEEIRSIGGFYKVLEECVLEYEGRKALAIVMAAAADTACCGPRGLGYISVQGFIRSWKSGTNDDGLAVSEVSRVREKGAQAAIKKMLEKRYPYINVIDFA